MTAFQSWHEFLLMGGYGFYVWSAYGFGFFILLISFWRPWRKNRSLMESE